MYVCSLCIVLFTLELSLLTHPSIALNIWFCAGNSTKTFPRLLMLIFFNLYELLKDELFNRSHGSNYNKA